MLEIIIGYFLGGIIIVLGVAACYASSIELAERKRQWRAGTHDYYGNKLNDDE